MRDLGLIFSLREPSFHFEVSLSLINLAERVQRSPRQTQAAGILTCVRTKRACEENKTREEKPRVSEGM